jgi:hypothetical protein
LNDPCSTNAPDIWEQRKKEYREHMRHEAFMRMLFATSQKESDEARKEYEIWKELCE